MAVQIIVHWEEDKILKKNGRMLCDERYVFEDKDVEVVFEITNEHMTAVLRPNSLSRL